MQPIRTGAEITTKIKIFPTKTPALYQKLSKKITRLRLLGLSLKEITKQLNISKGTVENALKFKSLPAGKIGR